MIAIVHPTPSPAAAPAPASSTLELMEARQQRDALKVLLRKEQAAMADFLIALADFDRRRGWERLGHANLFAFLHVDLRLSKSAAFYRKSAAALLQDFPEVIVPLRDGRLCLSTVAELAKVLTEENRTVVAPRFFGLSAREAQELAAELRPREVPSTRMVVTRVPNRPAAPPAGITQSLLRMAPSSESTSASSADRHPNVVPLSRVLTSDFANGGGGQPVKRRDEIEPLTAEVRRVHFNVGTAVVRKLEAAREGLSHAIRGATMEQVLEAALDLLLEKQARARGLVKKPRTVVVTASATARVAPRPSATDCATPTATPTATPATTATASASAIATDNVPPTAAAVLTPGPEPAAPTAATPYQVPNFTEPRHRREGSRQAIPAAVMRAVWKRDGGRCSWPLDSGGACGSTHRLELDHVVPWARWGGETVDDLRVVSHAHNKLAARQAFGARCVERYARKRT